MLMIMMLVESNMNTEIFDEIKVTDLKDEHRPGGEIYDIIEWADTAFRAMIEPKSTFSFR